MVRFDLVFKAVDALGRPLRQDLVHSSADGEEWRLTLTERSEAGGHAPSGSYVVRDLLAEGESERRVTLSSLDDRGSEKVKKPGGGNPLFHTPPPFFLFL